MKRALILILAAGLVAGCVMNRAALDRSAVNASRIRAVELGMAKADLLASMGPPDFQDRELMADGVPLERFKWLTNYDHHIYTVVTLRSGSVSAITQEEGPAP